MTPTREREGGERERGTREKGKVALAKKEGLEKWGGAVRQNGEPGSQTGFGGRVWRRKRRKGRKEKREDSLHTTLSG